MKNNISLSFCAIIFLLFAIFAFCGCEKEKNIHLLTENIMPAKDTITIQPLDTANNLNAKVAKYLALGDSYTIGQNVPDSERFPAQTVQLLKTHNINVTNPEYIATTGWTTTNLLSAINSQNPVKDFDIVTLLIGVNDQYQKRDTNGYYSQFTELVNKAIAFAAGKKTHVFVLSIPDYSVTPFVAESDKARVSMQIDGFNAINKEISLQKGVTYIDITPSTRKAADDPLLIANDGLHPSGKEYAVWANMLTPLIKKILQ